MISREAVVQSGGIAPGAAKQSKNIFAIASGKGGVGKTWFAITLAHIFARSGRRTLLFDGDIGLANVDVQLGLTPERDLRSVFVGEQPLKDIVTFYPKGGFDIIAGRSGSTSLASLTLARLASIRNELTAIASQYDYVIIDLGAGIEQNVQFLTSVADKFIVVITDEPTSLTDAYAFIKLCCVREPTPDVKVVVNMAPSQKEGERTFGALEKACQSFLHFTPSLLGVVRKDNKVRDAIRSQKSLVELAPHTTAATDVAAISVKLLKRD